MAPTDFWRRHSFKVLYPFRKASVFIRRQSIRPLQISVRQFGSPCLPSGAHWFWTKKLWRTCQCDPTKAGCSSPSRESFTNRQEDGWIGTNRWSITLLWISVLPEWPIGKVCLDHVFQQLSVTAFLKRVSLWRYTMCCIKTETKFEQNYLRFRKSSERENHSA